MKFHQFQLSCLVLLSSASVEAFAPINPQTNGFGYLSQQHAVEQQKQQLRLQFMSDSTRTSGIDTALMAAKGGGKKKRRRRKGSAVVPPPAPTPTPASASAPMVDESMPMPIPEGSKVSSGQDLPSIDELKSLASFDPKKGSSSSAGASASAPSVMGGGNAQQVDDAFSGIVEVPDIRDALKRKEMKKVEEEEKAKNARPKISRKDRKAMLQLLEEQPYADADDSYFEEEEYGTVSALLAEGARPFLGIPPGPLQVGHFIGALGIILCAFVEYPGFPLTNLPTPLRDALQGGLATVYLINTVLAVLATFKAAERGQSSALWAAKTFSVGGLAFDQLTQLPTLKEVEEIENRKGARAIKKKK